MSSIVAPELIGQGLPDQTQLPEANGEFAQNFQEHPQSMLLTDPILPVLKRRHPDGRFCIGQECGIYWRPPEPEEPPARAAVAPDWFYVANVAPTLDGHMRRSYVMWQEWVAPLIALEFASGDGSEERDQTEETGKFWIYEQAIRIPFYGIYEVKLKKISLYHLIDGHYEQLPPNARGHVEIAPLGVALGIWQGRFMEVELPWMRWWDLHGHLLLTGAERAAQELQRAERLASQLRALGIEPQS